MIIKYVGPKPHISHSGIDFDNNKEDKYVYLGIVLQLLKALNHDYFEDKIYVYDTDTIKVNDETLVRDLRRFCPNFDSLIDRESHDVEDEIQENIQRAHENEVLTPEEIQTLTNNINIMHDYLIQRAINKSVYYCAINALAQLLKKDHIDHIIAPMFQKFVHVLHSVQGVLEKDKFPIDTDMTIYQENKQLLVKLQVVNL